MKNLLKIQNMLGLAKCKLFIKLYISTLFNGAQIILAIKQYTHTQYYQNIKKMKLQSVFESIARFNYKHRGIVIIGSIALTLICSIGLLNFSMTVDPQNLWVSHDSIGYKQQMDFNDQYGAFFRTQQIILAQNGQKQQNIFDHDHLYSLYFLLSLINKKSITHQGRQIRIQNLCFRPIKGKGCYRPSPLDIWKMNITDLHLDDDIQYTAMCINSRSQTSRIPCSDQNQIPIIKESIYGGITCDESKDNKSSYIIPCEHCWIQSKAMLATYLLNNDEYTRESAQAWQKDVLIDAIHKYNADNGSFIQQYRKYFDVSPSGQVQFEGGFKLNINNYTSSKMNSHFQFMAQRSIPDQIGSQTAENQWIVVISYTAMFLYIGIAIGQFPSFVFSGFSLALMGIVIVLASVVSSMGVLAYFGIQFTMISAEVIPFLVLAIGVDNMFIIKSSIERQPYQKFEAKLVHGLKQVGPSIFTATICQALAFLVGSLTKMPALQTFCLQAAIAIAFNFVFQIFTFVVALIYDEQRRMKGRADVLCCIATNQTQSEPKNWWRRLFGGPYLRLLQKSVCQWSSILIAVLLLGLAGFGVLNVPVGLSEQVSMSIQSDLFNYFTYQKKYIQIGPPAYIVFNNFDYQNQTQIDTIALLNNQISKLKYIQPPVYSWFASFNNFKQKDAMWSEICGANNLDHLTYEDQLKRFLAVKITSGCCQTYGICGQQYATDLIFGDDGKLKSSRLRVLHKPLRNSYDYIRAARETRMAVEYALGPLLKSNPKLEAYPYSLFYVYYDQYSYIRSVAIQNLLLALAVVFLVVTLIQHIKIALVICGMVLLVTLDLIGFVYITNFLFPDHNFITQINAISVVNLITCVGLSVEFTAHMCISMFSLKGTQSEKLKASLQNTGSSVFIGIGLTKFTGVLVLGLAKSTLFRLYYFRMYLGIVLLGLFNGLVLLPILLYKWGPKSKQQQTSVSSKTMLTNSPQ